MLLRPPPGSRQFSEVSSHFLSFIHYFSAVGVSDIDRGFSEIRLDTLV